MRTNYGAAPYTIPHWTLLSFLLCCATLGLATNKGSGPVERQLTEGDRLSIPCRLETPGGSVQWVLNGQLVTLEDSEQQSGPRRRFWDVLGDGSAALTILGVSRKDQGHWDCWELAEDGVTVRKMTNVLRLTVVAAPQDPFLEVEGRRLAHQATLTLREHHVVPVACVVEDAFPAPEKMEWTLGPEPLTPVQDASPSPEGQGRSQVAINASREQHKAELLCRVQHPAWSRPAVVSAALNVLYAPSFAISREPGFGYPLLSGSRVWLHCGVDANPPSGEPVWLRDEEGGDSKVLPSLDGFLNFTSLSQDDVGWYRCATQHPVFGTFASFGYYLNVRDAPQSGLEQSDDVSRSTGPASQPQDSVPEADPCGGGTLLQAEPLNKSLVVSAGGRVLVSVRFCHSAPLTLVAWLIADLAIKPGQVRRHYVAHNLTSESPVCHRASLEVLEASNESSIVWFVVRDAQGTTGSARIQLNITGRQLASLVGISRASALANCGRPILVATCLLVSLVIAAGFHRQQR